MPRTRLALSAAAVVLLLFVAMPGMVGHASPGSPTVGVPAASMGPVPGRVVVAPAFSTVTSPPMLGLLPASDELTVIVGLAPSDPAAWSADLALETTPGSPEYRHYMEAQQFEAQLAPSTIEYERAVQYFSDEGLNVTPSPDRILLGVSGPPSAIATAFNTRLESFGTPSHWFYSHSTPASLPAGIPWSGVLGLGNESAVEPSRFATDPVTSLAGTSPSSSAASGCPTSGGAFVPCQIQSAYNETPYLQAGDNGTGVRIGIVDLYDGAEPQTRLAADFAKFTSTYGLPGQNVTFLYPVPTTKDLNGTNTGWGLEEALDLEWVRASAPGASIDMAFAPDASAGLYAAVDYLVAHQAVNVLSLSWGEPDVGSFNDAACGDACNATSDGSYALLHPVLMEAALEGIGVFAASGDCGAADGTNGVSTNYPASDPWVTGVGGTVLSLGSHDSYGSEVGWGGNVSGNQHCNNQGGSGGGYAPFPRPVWQAAPGLPSTPDVRGVPDVALDAGYPVDVVEGGQGAAVAGTSVATPIWAGFAAVADNASGGSLGFLDPALYSVLRGPEYHSAFHDVEQGWNGYYAGPGWDPVTGIGTPNLTTLLPLLNRSAFGPANFSVELFAGPRFGSAPLRTSFNVSIEGGVGTFPLVDVSFGDGSAALATNGRVNHTYESPGVYPAAAVVFDSQGNSSVSPLTSVVVGGGTALNVTLNSSDLRPTTGAAVTLSASTVGGVAPLHFDFAFGDGTYLNNSTKSSVSHVYAVGGGYCASVVVSDSGVPPSGGTSNRVPEAVGKGAVASCTPWVHLRATISSSFVAADLPGNFPVRISESGGAGPVAVQYVSDDAYVTACQCTIFRTAGSHTIVAFVNDSLNQEVRTQLNFTLYPALSASFSASTLEGSAPLAVTFRANASGGHLANASLATWQYGDGTHATGANVTHVFSNPGLYEVLANLADAGRGNASEAFLVDVGSSANTSALRLGVTIDPGTRVAGGSTLRAVAMVSGGTGPYLVAWSFGTFASAYGPEVNESLPVSGCVALGTCALDVNVSATDQEGHLLRGTVVLSPAEAGRSSALNWTDAVGPTNGTTPLVLTGVVHASGLPQFSVAWAFGDGTLASGASVGHSYLTAGNFTLVETVTDPWGDLEVRTHSITVRGRSIAPLVLSGGPAETGGVVPWTVSFAVAATGGGGGPYDFLWNFGDGNTSTVQNPTHTYTRAGAYNASVQVVNTLGVAANDSYTLVAYNPVPVTLTLHAPSQVLAGGPIPIELGASVACPLVAPVGCNVSQVTVELAVGDSPAGAGSGIAIPFPPSGAASLTVNAPDTAGPTPVVVTVEGPSYEGSAHATVEVEYVTVVPALVIGLVVAGAVAGVVLATVRRRRALNP